MAMATICTSLRRLSVFVDCTPKPSSRSRAQNNLHKEGRGEVTNDPDDDEHVATDFALRPCQRTREGSIIILEREQQ